MNQNLEVPLHAGAGPGDLGGGHPWADAAQLTSEEPRCPCVSSSPPWLDPGWPGRLRGSISTGDREVPWGREPLHPRLLRERGACAVQPPGAPVRLSARPICSGLAGPPLGAHSSGVALATDSLPWRRYVVESPRLPLAARLKPPFLRPELLERAPPLKVKLSDNGLKAGLGRSKVGAQGWARDGERREAARLVGARNRRKRTEPNKGRVRVLDARMESPIKPCPWTVPCTPLTISPSSPRAAWTGWMRSPWTWGRHCPLRWRPARLAATCRPRARAVLVRWERPRGGRGAERSQPDRGPSPPESALSAQRTSPPTPAMYKFRPAFPTGPKAPFCGPAEQVRPGPVRAPEAPPRRPRPWRAYLRRTRPQETPLQEFLSQEAPPQETRSGKLQGPAPRLLRRSLPGGPAPGAPTRGGPAPRSSYLRRPRPQELLSQEAPPPGAPIPGGPAPRRHS